MTILLNLTISNHGLYVIVYYLGHEAQLNQSLVKNDHTTSPLELYHLKLNNRCLLLFLWHATSGFADY